MLRIKEFSISQTMEGLMREHGFHSLDLLHLLLFHISLAGCKEARRSKQKL